MTNLIAATPLGELVDLVMGQAPSSKDCNIDGRGIPFVKVGEFGEERPVIREWTTNPLRLARRTDVLVCVVGATCGKVNLGEECAIGRSVAAIRPDLSKLDQYYLHYFMMTVVERLRSGSVGAAQTVISKEMIETIQFPLAPLREQQRIVGILDIAFAGIAIAKANAKKNLQNTRALFDSHLESIFSEHDSDWAEKKLSQVCAITSTLVDPRKDAFPDLVHVGAGNIESRTGAIFDLKTARDEELISGKFLFDESMVLYSKIRPYLMKVARPDFHGLCSADMYPLSPLPNEITRDYLYHLLLSKRFTDFAIQGSARAGMPKVNRGHMFEFKAWLPPLKKQTELAAKLDDLTESTQRLASLYARRLAALDALKRSLLYQAYTGDL